LLSETEFIDDRLAVDNACLALQESSEKNNLESSPPSKLVSLHQSAELRDVEIEVDQSLQLTELLLAHANTRFLE
jgi:hypothetical protein